MTTGPKISVSNSSLDDRLTNDTTAMAVFNKIDDNGGGVVLMEEWSEVCKGALGWYM